MPDLCYVFGGSERRGSPVDLPWIQHTYSPPGVLEQCLSVSPKSGQPDCPIEGITM
jgi:hypothetical protein